MTSATSPANRTWCRNCCAAKTLRARLRRGALSPERALDLALQLARGLTAAHETGRRAPRHQADNLFVSADGALKILDFGIAILQGSRERSADLE